MIRNESKNLLIIGIDHGYGNIKTANHCFRTGITGYDAEPLFTKDMLEYNGRYYIIGEGHKEFLASKKYSGQNGVRIVLVDTNLYRDGLLPSEKAKAFRMKYDAIKHACKGRKQKKNGCKKKNLPKEPFEEAVMKFIVETFLTDEAIGAISTMAADLANKEAEEKCMLHLYEKELATAEKRLQKAVDYILTHDDSEVMHDTLVESETRVKELKQVIIRERESYMPVYADDIAGWLRSYRTGNLKDINYCQNLVDMLVNKIVVYDPEPGSEYSKIIIYFNTDPKIHYELTQSDIDDSRSPTKWAAALAFTLIATAPFTVKYRYVCRKICKTKYVFQGSNIPLCH